MNHTLTPMATLVSVITLVLTGQPITPASAFMLLSFIDLVRKKTCSHIAHAMLQTYDAYVSLRRVEDFLILEDLVASEGKSSSTKVASGHLNQKEVLHPDQVKYQAKPSTLYVSNLTHR